MLPFMLLVMLRRYDEYAQDHRGHRDHQASSAAEERAAPAEGRPSA